MDKALEDKLLKLLALAKQGVGGEKINAEKFLKQLLDKHNLTIEDIDDDVTEVYWFRYKSNYERKLLLQLMYKIKNDDGYYASKYQKSKIGIELTKSQMIEIDFKFNIYKNALKEEFELSFKAFIHTNRIFPEKNQGSILTILSEEEREQLDKLFNRMSTMDPVQIRKQLRA